MRLWHKELIPVLPRQQLLSQWRECCCIARNIAVDGTPNHVLVNKVLEYPLEKDFYMYCFMVICEMKSRGYKVSKQSHDKWHDNMMIITKGAAWQFDGHYDIFSHWHNDRYLKQCYYNLQEKADCGGMSRAEWYKIQDHLCFLERDL